MVHFLYFGIGDKSTSDLAETAQVTLVQYVHVDIGCGTIKVSAQQRLAAQDRDKFHRLRWGKPFEALGVRQELRFRFILAERNYEKRGPLRQDGRIDEALNWFVKPRF